MPQERKALVQFLLQFVNEERLTLFSKVLENRTRYLTVVLEDIFQTQNASAVLRSCDCFGVQDVHIIENSNPFRFNFRVTHGAEKWLSINRYNKPGNNTPETLKSLKENGYRIVATIPDPTAVSLDDFDLTAGKTALVFGSEMPGISNHVSTLADEFLTIPMVGFSGSLNISVSAATILYTLTSKLRNSEIGWQLNDEERDIVLLHWIRKHVKRCDLLEKRFKEDYLQKNN